MSRFKSGGRRRLLAATLAFSVLQSGCVATAPPELSRATRDSFGVVAIAPARYVPQTNFVAFAKGKREGAAKGAAIGGGTAAATTAIVAATAAPITVPVIIIAGVVLTGAGTVIGGVVGAKQATPIETAQQLESTINAAVAGLDAQNKLAAQVASLVRNEQWIEPAPASAIAAGSALGPSTPEERPTYAQLSSAGVDTVLEVAITEIGLRSCEQDVGLGVSSGCGADPQRRAVDLYLTAQARLVRVTDGAELLARQLRYRSPHREIPLWTAKDGLLLAQEFDQAYRELAERVFDEAFLATPIELPSPSSFPEMPGPDNPEYGTCGLAPVSPPPRAIEVSEMFTVPFVRPADFCVGSGVLFSTVESLRPTLRWSAFPREIDRKRLDPAIVRRIRYVAYDLKIWQAEGCERGRLMYERSILPAPEHTLEESLAPATHYFWSVRARFAFDGRVMATRWASFNPASCASSDIANGQYHRFVTPK